MRKTLRYSQILLTAAGVALLSAACSSSTGAAAIGSPGASSGSAPASATGSAGPSAVSGSAGTTSRPSDTAAPPRSAGSPAASSASASGSAGYPVDLQPSTAAPGSQVMVYGLSCWSSTGTATSDAFTGTVPLSMISNATGGSARVKSALPAGRYTVTVTCGSVRATGMLTVS